MKVSRGRDESEPWALHCHAQVCRLLCELRGRVRTVFELLTSTPFPRRYTHMGSLFVAAARRNGVQPSWPGVGKWE